ncbi:serine/arginine repetitive matrix protein 1-like isoform X3 [Hordeum vulgare subsp. vulgare]|uniref:serine/arginine repetitive matrix protein 1-like isoform X3 n=1 Tax=Hordeum vulgare subsp. vulgare TaxID=112509 RepID=UPI001D1A5849|nr:serine/arginine repetitive matrix protein 1-like isoform X3 [Hordeum vulgare subsp. vulgare]
MTCVQVPRAMARSRSPKGEGDSRRRSPPRRSSGEQGGRKEQGPVSLLVRNIPHNCRSEDLRVPFEKFGPVWDVHMPKDYYSGEPKGFAFIEFSDPHDASEAQYHMNSKLFCGREIKVVPATAKRKRPEDMRRQTGVRVHSGSKRRHLSRHGRSRSRSHSRSPRHGGRDRSRSHSPAPRRRGDYSASPKRKEECQAKSSGQSKEHDNDKKLGPCTPGDRSEHHDTDNDSNERQATPDYSAVPKRKEECQTKSPKQPNEHDVDKKCVSFSPDKNNCRDADNGHNERDDYSTSSKKKGERLARSPRLSKEHGKDKKQRSYSRDDRSDCRDADNGFKESPATTDGKGSSPHQKSPRSSSGSHSRRRDAYSAPPKGKEERREQSPRQSKEHDKHRKWRSNTPDDRNDCRHVDHSHNDSNLHVDRKPVTPDGEGSHACRRSPRPSSGSHSRRRDDCSASPKRKEARWAKSPKQSTEHEDENRRSCSPDDINGRHNSVDCYKKKRDGYSASPKIKECRLESPQPTKEREDKKRSYAPDDGIDRTDADNGYNERRAGPDCASQKRMEKPSQANSQSQSKEHDNDKKHRSYTHIDGKELRDAHNGSKERRKDDSAAGKRKEERQASLPRQSKEYDEHKKSGSYTRDNRNDYRDADNGSKERQKNYPAAGKRKEEHQASLPRQSKEHDEHKKRGSYTCGNRNEHRDADNGSKERQKDYPTAGKRKEEHQASLPRQSKEHDEHKKRGSYTCDDRNEHRDADNGSKERQKDYSAAGKRKEEHQASLPRQSKEHGAHKKRGSYTRDDRNDLRGADKGSKERRKDYPAAGKRKEEHQASLPRQSKEHDEHKKRGSYTRDDRNDLRDADNSSKERKDYAAAGMRKEERQASLPRQSKEHDEHKGRGSYTRNDRDDPRDVDNGSKESRNDYSAAQKGTEDHRAKSSRQSEEHDNDNKRGSYTVDDRSHHCDADNGSREKRGDFSDSGQRKEEYRGKSLRQLKEHGDNKKRGSDTPADRNDLRDVDNGCNEKLATHGGSPCPGQRSPLPSCGSGSRSEDKTLLDATTDRIMEM